MDMTNMTYIPTTENIIKLSNLQKFSKANLDWELHSVKLKGKKQIPFISILYLKGKGQCLSVLFLETVKYRTQNNFSTYSRLCGCFGNLRRGR